MKISWRQLLHVNTLFFPSVANLYERNNTPRVTIKRERALPQWQGEGRRQKMEFKWIQKVKL